MQTVTLFEQSHEVIDHAEALRYVNLVREAWGWELLDELPKAEPNDPCRCVLGKSWRAKVSGSALYEDSYLWFEADELAPLAAKALDVDPHSHGRAITLPSDHPLLAWMVAFDQKQFGDLIEDDWEDA